MHTYVRVVCAWGGVGGRACWMDRSIYVCMCVCVYLYFYVHIYIHTDHTRIHIIHTFRSYIYNTYMHTYIHTY